MGYMTETKCNDCGEVFDESYGGGFNWDQLRCTNCGKTKDVHHFETPELWEKFIRTLDFLRDIQIDNQSKELDYLFDLLIAERQRRVEEFAGKCDCGGKYTFDAPPRCPKCGSTNVKEEENGPTLCYD